MREVARRRHCSGPVAKAAYNVAQRSRNPHSDTLDAPAQPDLNQSLASNRSSLY